MTNASSNVLAFRRKRALTARAALKFLYDASKDGVIEVASYTDLGVMFGWDRRRARTAVQRWVKAGKAKVETASDGGLVITVWPDRRTLSKGRGTGVSKPRARPPQRRGRSGPQTDIKNEAESDINVTSHGDTKVPDRPSGPPTYENHEISGQAVFGPPPKVENTSRPDPNPAPANTSTRTRPVAEQSSPAVTAERGERTDTQAITRGEVRPPMRRGGGIGGGGGFDAVESFRHATWAERLLILIAAGLSGTAASMSVSGMVVLYPLEPITIMVFGGLIECAKFFGFSVIAAGWRHYGGVSRWTAAALLLVAAIINASGVYGKLIANHTTTAAGRTAAFAEHDADQGAKLEVASGKLADIDRRIGLIDGAAEGAAKRGRSKSALSAIDAQKRQRAALVAERHGAAQEVASLKAGRSGMAARHQEDEAAATPVRYAAALFEDFGLIQPGTDPERLMRWLSFMLLLAGDPLALALMVAINSRARRQGGAA
jgi:hypothetical protein